ncbi:DUF2520 domain-containing protein [Clostridium sp. 19966]|nr:DUF2520 domain-containing protein [Clostridium sp. 19966]
MKTGFIGAGKMGFTLGKLFSVNDIPLSGYYSRTYSSSKAASSFTDSKCYDNLKDLIHDSNILFITVPDDEILNTYNQLKDYDFSNKIICHTSGCLTSKIFSDIDKYQAYSYSIHPIFPVSDKYESYKFIKNATFTIEGSEKYMDYFKKIFTYMNIKLVKIKSSNKSMYHLASVNVSNIFLSLVKRSCSYLIPYGFSEEDAINALYPLINSNIENFNNNGLSKALTGPLERGDMDTIKKHISAMPEAHRRVYADLSYELLEIAKLKNKNRDYSKIEIYLEELKNEKYSSDL